MAALGRMFILLSVLFLIVGGTLLLFDRMNVPLGRLPGDFLWRGRGWTVSFPLVTCAVVSVVLSLLFWLVNWLRR